MQIILYKYSGDNRVINKTLTNSLTLPCDIITPLNVLSPNVIILTGANRFDYNYAYIPQLHRYYFISNYTLQAGNQIELDLNVDIYHTAKEVFENSESVILRCNEPSDYVDSKFPVEQEYFTESRFIEVFDSANTQNIIVCVR